MEDTNQRPNPQTVDLIYLESKDAHAKLMSDVDAYAGKVDQQIQTSLVVIGILFAVVGTVAGTDAGLSLAASLPNSVSFTVLISTILLVISAVISISGKLWGRFSSGTIYPHILAARVVDLPEDIKIDLIDSLSRSYYYNLKTLATKSRYLVIAGILQLTAIFSLFIGVAIIVFRLINIL